MGEALIKEEIIQLADEFIKGTVHKKNKEYCEKRGIEKDWET